ncbi:hypothetical protein [Xanthomonas sp. 1678]|uniref:hypothetical protein n=1 Tax=Xanthomonas sp. 1678 TaxID=3158788 RepID=UPI00285E7FD9|nr:hypothetical protein [Xanthomonas translucens]
MTRATDILDALLARSPRKLLRDRRTGLPYGWAHWIASQPVKPRPFVSSQLIAALPAPALAPTARLPALSAWQAFRRLWWQDWDPAPYDQRWWRRIAALVSLALHLLFALFLLWVAFVRLLPPRPDAGEAGRVQVEFVGRGTPAETGGGAAAQDAAAAAAAQQAAAAAARQAAATAAAQTAAAARAASATPASAAQAVASPPPLPPEQPLQVTETAQPRSDFVLPPPSVREPALTPREIAPPSVQVTERQIDVVTEVPIVAQIRPREVAVPRPPAPQLQVREREVPAPLPQVQVQVPQIRPREPAPTLRAAEAPQVRQIELPTPAAAAAPVVAPPAQPSDATASAPANAAASAQSATPTSTAAQGKAETQAPAGTGAAPPGSRAAAPGSGPAAVARDGGWATPQRGDDWGASARNRAGDAGAGQRNGLFNGDGSVRVPGGEGQGKAPPRGAPGTETDSWSRDQIAKAGEWLKRPPYDYKPTSFDKYWLPNATLLEEWVRRGVKTVNIPIPGTTSSISCVVSILQLGGGCGITDPNLNDQPASARPPPDVPFKPGLQEDNGSVK